MNAIFDKTSSYSLKNIESFEAGRETPDLPLFLYNPFEIDKDSLLKDFLYRFNI